PMVLIEAAAHGIICVSSDCRSGPAEIVQPGENGWLYPVGDVDALAARLQVLVDAPLELPSQERVRATALRYAAPAIAGRARQAIVEAGTLR
ncbi:MAG TPA: glycosyltransferase, partial [Acidobacteriaceae bacterium]